MKKLSKFAVTFLLCLFLANSVYSEPIPHNPPQFKTTIRGKFVQIISDLMLLLSKGKNRKLQQLMLFIDDKVNQKKLSFQIDPERAANMRGVRFVVTKQNKPVIVISEKLIASYNPKYSIVYSMLIHHFQNAKAFFTDENYLELSKNSPIEKYLYSLDAYHMEALFIKEYIKNNPRYKLTAFEGYLGRPGWP
ncbi:MAG: hypothetical protein AAF518_19145 [Spirochaetota bacterium]